MKNIKLHQALVLIIFLLLLLFFFSRQKNNAFVDDPNCIVTRPKIDYACIVKKNDITNNDNNYKENQIGIIKINGTNINSPIMQENDNDYYLNHDSDGNYDVYGSIFMDYRNNINDKKILIFGHNTNGVSTSPFHDLEKYTDYNFYQQYQYIDLTLVNTTTKWQIFSVMIVSNTSNKHMKLKFNNNEWNEHLSWLINSSKYQTGITVNDDDRIIVLQTCFYQEPETFLIISAKEIK